MRRGAARVLRRAAACSPNFSPGGVRGPCGRRASSAVPAATVARVRGVSRVCVVVRCRVCVLRGDKPRVLRARAAQAQRRRRGSGGAGAAASAAAACVRSLCARAPAFERRAALFRRPHAGHSPLPARIPWRAGQPSVRRGAGAGAAGRRGREPAARARALSGAGAAGWRGGASRARACASPVARRGVHRARRTRASGGSGNFQSQLNRRRSYPAWHALMSMPHAACPCTYAYTPAPAPRA